MNVNQKLHCTMQAKRIGRFRGRVASPFWSENFTKKGHFNQLRAALPPPHFSNRMVDKKVVMSGCISHLYQKF